MQSTAAVIAMVLACHLLASIVTASPAPLAYESPWLSPNETAAANVSAPVLCPMPLSEKLVLRTLWHLLGGVSWVWSDVASAAVAVSDSEFGTVIVGWEQMRDPLWPQSTAVHADPCRAPWFGVQCWSVANASMMHTCSAGLGSLVLRQRGLKGSMPSSDVWTAFTGLRRLDLSDNSITGTIDGLGAWFHNIVAFGSKPFSFAGIRATDVETSPVPDCLAPSTDSLTLARAPGTLVGTSLSLASNTLSGDLNAVLASFHAVHSWYFVSFAFNTLLSIDVSTLLTGSVYPSMLALDVSRCLLSGVMPAAWATTLPNLLYLSVMAGKLPAQPLPRALPSSLRSIVFGENSFVGSIPDEWENLAPGLQGLSLELNQLSGTLPAWIARADQLRVLSLMSNAFSGSPWPAVCGNQSASAPVRDLFYAIDVNQFSGPLDPCIARGLPPLLTRPRVKTNAQTGQWVLRSNRFSGSLSDDSLSWLADSPEIVAALEEIIWDENLFTAPNGFAAYWKQMRSLRRIVLANNPLGFNLGSTDDAAGNSSTSTLPLLQQSLLPLLDGITTAPLELLLPRASCDSNVSHGLISLQSMPELISLDLGSTQLTGRFADFTDAARVRFAANTAWPRLAYLSLKNNDLSGAVNGGVSPLSQLHSLSQLDVSYNAHATGSLEDFETITSISAKGCPLLSVQQVDKLYPMSQRQSFEYIIDPIKPGIACPSKVGGRLQFEVDGSYHFWSLCQCQDGWMRNDTVVMTASGPQTLLGCAQIPFVTRIGAETSGPAEQGDPATHQLYGLTRSMTHPGLIASFGSPSFSALAGPSGPGGPPPTGLPPPPTDGSAPPGGFPPPPSGTPPSGPPPSGNSTNGTSSSGPSTNPPVVRLSDALYGSSRAQTGLDTNWLLDYRSVFPAVRTIDLRFYFDPTVFTGIYNRLEVYHGDDSLSGDRIASWREAELQSFPWICFRNATEAEVRMLQAQWVNVSSPLAVSCARFTHLFVFSSVATINFRSRDKTGAHFFAEHTTFSECPRGFLAPSDTLSATSTQCGAAYQLDTTVQISVYVSSSVVALVQLVFLVLLVHHRGHAVMRGASPEWLGLILVSLLALTAGAATFAVAPSAANPSADPICDVRVWLLSLGLLVSLAAFAMKTERIRQIYSGTTLKRTTLAASTMVAMFASLTMIAVTLLVVASALQLYYPVVLFGSGSGSGGTSGYAVPMCSWRSGFSAWLGVEIGLLLLLLAWSARNAWRIRRVAVAFNESTTAAAFVLLYGFFVVVLMPLQSLLRDSPSAQMLIMGVGLSACSFALALATMAAKLYYIASARPLAAIVHPRPTVLAAPGTHGSTNGNAARAAERKASTEEDTATNESPAARNYADTAPSSPAATDTAAPIVHLRVRPGADFHPIAPGLESLAYASTVSPERPPALECSSPTAAKLDRALTSPDAVAAAALALASATATSGVSAHSPPALPCTDSYPTQDSCTDATWSSVGLDQVCMQLPALSDNLGMDIEADQSELELAGRPQARHD